MRHVSCCGIKVWYKFCLKQKMPSIENTFCKKYSEDKEELSLLRWFQLTYTSFWFTLTPHALLSLFSWREDDQLRESLLVCVLLIFQITQLVYWNVFQWNSELFLLLSCIPWNTRLWAILWYRFLPGCKLFWHRF